MKYNLKRLSSSLLGILLGIISFLPLVIAETTSPEISEKALGGFFTMFGVVFLLFMLLGLILFGLMIVGIIFWIMMIIDVVNTKFPKEEDRIVWILVVIVLGILGGLVYYFVVKRKNATILKKSKLKT